MAGKALLNGLNPKSKAKSKAKAKAKGKENESAGTPNSGEAAETAA